MSESGNIKKGPSSSSNKKEGGFDLQLATGAVAQFVGNIAMFTGLVGASLVILAIAIDPMGLYAIPVLVLAGFGANAGGRYMRHRKKTPNEKFEVFGALKAA